MAREEIEYHLKQWTFYVTVLGTLLVFAGLGAMPRLQSAAEASPLASLETVFTVTETLTVPTGYVDNAGLITWTPEGQADNFRAFSHEAAAGAALEAGEIESYYVITADYVESGEVVHYSHNPQLLAGADAPVKKLLQENLLLSLKKPDLADRLREPARIHYQGPPPPVLNLIPTDLDRQRLLSAGLVVSLFAIILNTGGILVLRALRREVRARVLEFMVASITPGQFVGGKLLGLATLALGQSGLSLAAGLVVYRQNLGDVGAAALPLDTVIISMFYLLLGYVAYCGAMMAAAVLWPDLPESALLLTAVRFLALSPLIGVLFILIDPDGAPAVALTLLPVTSPLLMPFRLVLTITPWWQVVLGLAALAAWAGFSVWLSARLFRLQSLLTGRAASPRLVWQALTRP